MNSGGGVSGVRLRPARPGIVMGRGGGALGRRVYRRGEDRILSGRIIYMGRKRNKGSIKIMQSGMRLQE